MLLDASWHTSAIETLRAMLEPDRGVLGLVVFGSVASAAHDAWSDLDVLLVVSDEARTRYFPSLDWLAPLGEIYTFEQSSGQYTEVSRVCLQDLRRIDFVVTTEAALAQIDRWPSVAFANPQSRAVHFSRSMVLDHVLSRSLTKEVLHLPSPEEFLNMADAFWYKGILAVSKVVRDDRLIALHLALEMVQDCLELGMLIRDRNTGTAHHRVGGTGNAVVDAIGIADIPATGEGILLLVERGGLLFDSLATTWDPRYEERRHPLQIVIDSARLSIRHTDR